MSQSIFSIFWRFLVLGCYSFGGPTAHIGYFRREFVEKRQWLSDEDYADTVALCQMLPGPASSQVGMAIGYQQQKLPGAIAAFLGFTLPSALLMILLAYGYSLYSDIPVLTSILHGIKIFAVAVVADALIGMGRNLCPDKARVTMALLAAAAMLLLSSVFSQLLVIAVGALAGFLLFQETFQEKVAVTKPVENSKSTFSAILSLVLFLAWLLLLPVLAGLSDSTSLQLFDSFYRAGALVFGGGHVVLPMLQAEVVYDGGVNADAFIAGYSAAQAVPGPMFTLAPFLGGAYGGQFSLVHALVALAGIFLPSLLLLTAALPFWNRLKEVPSLKAAIKGINATVVGLLLAAFYDPVVNLAIRDAKEVALALVAFMLLSVWKLPVGLMVLIFGGLGWVLF
ncbi:chromate efflux transporter [Endozoicomonas sp. OPT23]|uniref:chromate efflux transporter n=1 Tax=Endozoicomonas sp. OPT23 TaxID=2072845 RepID=UPI001E5BD6E9|nr:chromate efflux transporter [Endozoicomonas sp. OPT23]